MSRFDYKQMKERSMRLKLSLTACTLILLLMTPAWSQTVLRIQDYPGLGNFLARVANANGLCEKHGLKCESHTIPQAPLGLQSLLAGDIEVAHAPPEVLVQAAAALAVKERRHEFA